MKNRAKFNNFIGYISYSNAFKKPLSKEDEQKYLDLYFEGDMDARDKLIEHNLRLAAHIAKKFSLANLDNEELISIGTVGLVKGINTYKPDKKTRLSTYVSRCIENEILMWIRNQKKYRGDLSLQQPLGIDKDGNEVTIEDKLYDNARDVDEQVETDMQIEEMKNILEDVLTEDELQVIELRYGIDGDELTQREIAKIMGISRSYVSRIEKKALQKLEKVLN